MQTFEQHLNVVNDKQTILDLLSQACDLSKAEIKKAIDKGALWHSRGKTTLRCRRLKKPLKSGDQLHFYYNSQVLAQQTTPAILIEDYNDYSVWYKPYGMLSQGSKWSDHCTIMRWAQKNLQPERAVFSVHRLDRAASGLIIVAHSKKVAAAFSKLFEQHHLEKVYHILIHGDHRIRPQPETINQAIDGKAAVSHFRCLAYCEKHQVSLVEVKIESGRKHQIRLHAASIGMPVVGDRLHGIQASTLDKVLDLQLCAVKLSFKCPITQIPRAIELPIQLAVTLPK